MKPFLMMLMGVTLLIVGFSNLPSETHSLFEMIFFGGWNVLVFLFLAANIRHWLLVRERKAVYNKNKRVQPIKRKMMPVTGTK